MPTLERLGTYWKYLNELEDNYVETLSSANIETGTGINAAQFRKDLSYFGEFGRPGIGYNVHDLQKRIAHILKVDKVQPVLLVGAGNLGSALIGYPGLKRFHFHIVGAFDIDDKKIGSKLWDLDVMDVRRIKEANEELEAKIAILTVPPSAAQSVTDRLVDAGIKVILNFAPCALHVPESVLVREVCFIQELTVLSYHLSS